MERELYKFILVVEGGKRRKIGKIEAMVKQQMSKALSGDLKAVALVMGVLERRSQNSDDTLSPLLSAMRAIHAKHEADDPEESEP